MLDRLSAPLLASRHSLALSPHVSCAPDLNNLNSGIWVTTGWAVHLGTALESTHKMEGGTDTVDVHWRRRRRGWGWRRLALGFRSNVKGVNKCGWAPDECRQRDVQRIRPRAAVVAPHACAPDFDSSDRC